MNGVGAARIKYILSANSFAWYFLRKRQLLIQDYVMHMFHQIPSIRRILVGNCKTREKHLSCGILCALYYRLDGYWWFQISFHWRDWCDPAKLRCSSRVEPWTRWGRNKMSAISKMPFQINFRQTGLDNLLVRQDIVWSNDVLGYIDVSKSYNSRFNIPLRLATTLLTP